MKHSILVVTIAIVTIANSGANAQQRPAPARPATQSAAAPAAAVAPPAGYVIGPEDLLTIVFWRDEALSGDVVVRPDGKISLPLLNDVQAAGFTPEQLRTQLIEAASKFIEAPNATVVVKQINSNKVYVTGSVARQGLHPVGASTTVLQLIALAGGMSEFADSEKIQIIRNENGNLRYFKFNYKDVVKGKNTQQNIALRPGDTVVVP